jgi:hypothetical protein
MKSHWIYYQDIRIFLADFSNYGSNGPSVKAETQYIIEMLKNEPGHSVLSVTYVEGTFANEDILRALTDLLPISNAKIKRRAVVGVAGFRRHFLDAFASLVGNVKFSAFDTLEQAYAWLVTGS